MPLHVGKGRTESRAISDIIDYVANPQKTDNGKLITGYACDSRTVDVLDDKLSLHKNEVFIMGLITIIAFIAVTFWISQWEGRKNDD